VSTHPVSGPLSRTSTSAKAPPPAPASGSTNLTRTKASALVSIRRWLVQASEQWLPRLAWSVQRTGRAGLSGVALLLASLVFLVSTHLPLAREVEQLRSQLQVAHAQAVKTPVSVSDSGTVLLHSLPGRAQMPALLGILLHQAGTAHLTIDTGKYETTALKSGGVMTYQISFPVTGPYPQVRQFIDATLAALPAVAVTELSLTRKTIGDGAVEAQIRLTAFTQDRP
jgi:Tfp pilus assembly protein PilO